jgi:hypothetical protein
MESAFSGRYIRMMFALAASVFVAVACGFLLIFCCLSFAKNNPFSMGFMGAMSAGMGLGVCSIVSFLGLAFCRFSKPWTLAADCLLLVVLASFAVMRWWNVQNDISFSEIISINAHTPPTKHISALFLVSLCLSAVIFCGFLLIHPHGAWDACAIWNFRARFLFRNGLDMVNAFSGLHGWDHSDYPPLVPLAVLRTWLYAGQETVGGPFIVSGIFTFATVGLLVAALNRCKSGNQGFLGGIALLGIPLFVKLGAFQYADVPLSFFFLATVVLGYLYLSCNMEEPAVLLLMGIMASLSAWTKNEGLLFIGVVPVAFLIAGLWRKNFKGIVKGLALLLVAALPVLLVLIYFKLMIAPGNDLIEGLKISALVDRIWDLSRYTTVLSFLVSRTWDVEDWNVFPFLLTTYFLMMRPSALARSCVDALFPALTVLLMAAGYLCVYVIFSVDLVWHLERSFDRLILQLTPSALFAFFLIVRPVDEILMTGGPPSVRRPVLQP